MAGAMELLAPAGGREQLEYAVHFGADAVYLASERYGMRRRADNFTEETLPAAIAFAHAHGVRVHVTANVVMTDDDINDLPRYFRFLDAAGADAVIVSDMGAIAVAREVAPRLDIHLSTQASCMNAASARAYQALGVRRIVVAREMSLDAITRLRSLIPSDLELEAFVHGAMCMAYSGRCLISDHLTGRGANVGHCTQPCRWKYSLVEETRPGETFPIEQDERGSFILSSNDMCMLAHLDELAAAGVNSVKVEGRAKGAYYVASVVNAYRHVLDGESAAAWQPELETTSHRPFCTGFYFGAPGQNKGSVEYERSYQMVACVQSCEPADEGDAVAAGQGSAVAEGQSIEAAVGLGASASVGAETAGAIAGFGSGIEKAAGTIAGLCAATSKKAAEGKRAETAASLGAGASAGVSQPFDSSTEISCATSSKGAWRARVVCRNRFFEDEVLEVLSPHVGVRTCKARNLVWHCAPGSDVADVEKRGEGACVGPDPRMPGGKLARVNVANRTMESYSLDVPFQLCAGDILRVSRPNQTCGRNL